MGVRRGRRLPPCSQATRITFGTLTTLVWYAGMLSALSFAALLFGRSFQEVGRTAFALLGLTAVLWWLRLLVRHPFVPTHTA